MELQIFCIACSEKYCFVREFVPTMQCGHGGPFSANMRGGKGNQNLDFLFPNDNLSFVGDVTLSRKHTRQLIRDLPNLVRDAFLKFRNLHTQQEARIAGYKNTRIHDRTAHDLFVQAVDHEVIPVIKLPTVVSEWRTPSHNEFTNHGRSLWRLHNAFSESWKGANLNTLPRRSQRLHQLLDRVCGFQLAV